MCIFEQQQQKNHIEPKCLCQKLGVFLPPIALPLRPSLTDDTLTSLLAAENMGTWNEAAVSSL